MMTKHREIVDCWTQNELRSLVEAMTKRSIFDSQVDFIDSCDDIPECAPHGERDVDFHQQHFSQQRFNDRQK